MTCKCDKCHGEGAWPTSIPYFKCRYCDGIGYTGMNLSENEKLKIQLLNKQNHILKRIESNSSELADEVRKNEYIGITDLG